VQSGDRCTAKRFATLSYTSLPKHKTTADNPDLRVQAQAGQPCFKRTSKVVFNYPAKLNRSLPAASYIYPEQPTGDAVHIPAFNYDYLFWGEKTTTQETSEA